MNRYENNNIISSSDGIQYYNTSLYPQIVPQESDIYLITTVGDRLDIIANQYYKDPTLWWIIASSNNLRMDTVFAPPGSQLRVPVDLSSFGANFNAINKNR